MAGRDGEVSNKQILFRDYVTGFPKETDMVVNTSSVVLKVPQGSNSVLVKNLYLSCDPYMRSRMKKIDDPTYYVTNFIPGSVYVELGATWIIWSFAAHLGALLGQRTGATRHAVLADTVRVAQRT